MQLELLIWINKINSGFCKFTNNYIKKTVMGRSQPVGRSPGRWRSPGRGQRQHLSAVKNRKLCGTALAEKGKLCGLVRRNLSNCAVNVRWILTNYAKIVRQMSKIVRKLCGKFLQFQIHVISVRPFKSISASLAVEKWLEDQIICLPRMQTFIRSVIWSISIHLALRMVSASS